MANYWKKRREALDKSQRRVAMEIGISNTLVGYWEKDEAVPSLELLAGLMRAYDVSEEEIVRQIVAQTKRLTATRQPAIAK